MNSGITREYTFAMCVYYVPIGALAALANFVNLAMYAHSKEARKTYMVFIALELGELINSLSFILTGAGRLEDLLSGHLYHEHSVHECFYTTYFVHAQILGTELPTLFLMQISMERICAVCWPERYNRIFTAWGKGLMIAACTLLALGSIGAAAGSAYNNEFLNSSGHCGIIHSTAKWYSTFHFIFIVIGFSSSLTSLLTMKFYSLKFRNTSAQAFRHDTKTNTLIAFMGASLVLVASPSIVMIGMRWGLFELGDVWIALSYSTTVLVSIANMIINFVFREDFRRTFFQCTNKVGITHHNDELFSHLHHTTST
ncbi:hypothetical protein PMAYCL1PPCAC_13424, partial [Pristionchus mayeri]